MLRENFENFLKIVTLGKFKLKEIEKKNFAEVFSKFRNMRENGLIIF